MLQLRDALHHCLAGLRLELLSRGTFLLVDVHPIRIIDSSGKGRLHLPDAFFGEIPFLWVRGEEDHVDMHLIWLLVEGGIPAQVVRLDLVRRRDVVGRRLDQRLPVFRTVVAKALGVLTAQRDHRRPHISGVLRYLPYRLREILYLAVGVPQTMLAVLLDAGAVGDVVDEIFLP